MKVSDLIGAIGVLIYTTILVAACADAFVRAVNEDSCRVKGGAYAKTERGWECLKVERK